MPASPLSSAQLVERFSGMVVESLAVKQDFGTATVGCRVCGQTLSAGSPVSVALTCYEDHSWEIEELACGAHGVASVARTMGVRAENQAVVRAILETAPYLAPDETVEPEALRLGEVAVLDYSPTADGY